MHVIQQKCPFLLPNAHIARSNAPVNEVAVQILTEQTAQTHTHTHTQKERESKKENRSECWPQRRGDTSDRSNCGKISIRNRRLDPHTHTHTHTLNGIWTESSRRIHN